MTIKSYRLQDGKLLLGTGPAYDVSAQMRSIQVDWSENVSTIDAIPVLSNEEIPEEESATYKATLSGTFLQALLEDEIVDWTWAHRGEVVMFRFVPDNTAARGAEGTVRVIPIKLGGEITRPAGRPTSDFTWNCVGDLPIFGPADPVTDDVTEDV